MRLTFVLFVVAVVVMASQPFARPEAVEAAGMTRVFIQLDGGFRSADSAELSNLGARVRHVFSASNTISVDLPENLVSVLLQLPRFQALRLVPQVTAVEDQLPWGVDQINAERVWGGGENAVDVTPGANDGSGVVIAVIDTGIAARPDLNIVGGISFVDGTSSYNDDNGHGTHVSGTAAARDNGTGVIGVAPGAGLLAVKVLNYQGKGGMDDVAAGIEWAAAHGADVINMSLACSGFGCDDPVMEDALAAAAGANVVIVAAAGNWGDVPNAVGWPAQAPQVIAVGATDSNNNWATFSSTGPAVEVAAPGAGILSTVPTTCGVNFSQICSLSGFNTLSGTSMASPHVAGAAALLVNCGYSAVQVRSLLDSTADDLGATGRDSYFGYGLIDLPAATASCPSGGTPTPTPTPGGPVTDDFDSGTWSGGSGWAGAWDLGGTLAGYTSLTRLPSPQSGSYQALLRGNGSITRAFSLNGFDTASLSFWAQASSWEADDGAVVQVSINNSTWTAVQTFADGFDDSAGYQHFVVDLDPWAGDSVVYLRFKGEMNSYFDYFYVDSINVSDTDANASPTPTPTPTPPPDCNWWMRLLRRC